MTRIMTDPHKNLRLAVVCSMACTAPWLERGGLDTHGPCIHAAAAVRRGDSAFATSLRKTLAIYYMHTTVSGTLELVPPSATAYLLLVGVAVGLSALPLFIRSEIAVSRLSMREAISSTGVSEVWGCYRWAGAGGSCGGVCCSAAAGADRPPAVMQVHSTTTSSA